MIICRQPRASVLVQISADGVISKIAASEWVGAVNGYVGLYPRNRFVAVYAEHVLDSGVPDWDRSAKLRVDDHVCNLMDKSLSISMLDLALWRCVSISDGYSSCTMRYLTSVGHMLADSMQLDCEDVLLMAYELWKEQRHAPER